MLFRLMILVIQLKKAYYNKKTEKIRKKIPNHDKFITTKEFNQLKDEDFAERLKQRNLYSKNDEFVKETNFDEKLIKNKVTKIIK